MGEGLVSLLLPRESNPKLQTVKLLLCYEPFPKCILPAACM